MATDDDNDDADAGEVMIVMQLLGMLMLSGVLAHWVHYFLDTLIARPNVIFYVLVENSVKYIK